MTSTETFDAIIIGSGQAGNPLALALAKEKWKVALIEKGKLGGTCVNTGCTPTKMYVASARRMWEINNAKELGIKIPSPPKIDLKAVKSRKNNLIEESRTGIEKSLQENAQITLIRGAAEFIDAKRIQVGSRIIQAEKFFINVGARPVVLEGFESVEYLTNESILELEEVPKELIVLGGSYIGLEFAQMFARFGSKVTIIESSDFLISKEDEDISNMVQDILEEQGVEVFCSAEQINAQKLESRAIAVHFEIKGKTQLVSGSHVLLAVGRKPNSDLIQPEKAGIETDKKGYIKVNSKLETNVAGIYALGDCNGEGAFTHTAYHDFEIIKNQLFNDQSKTLKDRVMNYALYIDPPMGRVGMTKKQANESGKEILYAAMPMSEISRAKEKGETQGKMEVLIDAKTERILGATVLGTGGDEVIGTFITAIYADASYKSLMNSVQTHPTVTELIPTLLQNLQPLVD
jgi:pyruvate/2-oxoglutarate dehydrogenase complex dihydrolipoamide dehydrogenase (E3) component